MDINNWQNFEDKLRLKPIFKGYTVGFESLYDNLLLNFYYFSYYRTNREEVDKSSLIKDQIKYKQKCINININ